MKIRRDEKVGGKRETNQSRPLRMCIDVNSLDEIVFHSTCSMANLDGNIWNDSKIITWLLGFVANLSFFTLKL